MQARNGQITLGPKGIRVHAISPGPLRTRAASGLQALDDLINEAATKAPAEQLASIEDVGIATASLATPDGGYHIMS